MSVCHVFVLESAGCGHPTAGRSPTQSVKHKKTAICRQINELVTSCHITFSKKKSCKFLNALPKKNIKNIIDNSN